MNKERLGAACLFVLCLGYLVAPTPSFYSLPLQIGLSVVSGLHYHYFRQYLSNTPAGLVTVNHYIYASFSWASQIRTAYLNVLILVSTLFHETVQTLVDSFPMAACGVLTPYLPVNIFSLHLSLMGAIKLYFTVMPQRFLGLDHEHLWKSLKIAGLCLIMVDVTARLWLNNVFLCIPKVANLWANTLLSLKVDVDLLSIDTFNYKFPTVLIINILACLFYLVSVIIILRKNFSQRRVAPLYKGGTSCQPQLLETEPTFALRNIETRFQPLQADSESPAALDKAGTRCQPQLTRAQAPHETLPSAAMNNGGASYQPPFPESQPQATLCQGGICSQHLIPKAMPVFTLCKVGRTQHPLSTLPAATEGSQAEEKLQQASCQVTVGFKERDDLAVAVHKQLYNSDDEPEILESDKLPAFVEDSQTEKKLQQASCQVTVGFKERDDLAVAVHQRLYNSDDEPEILESDKLPAFLEVSQPIEKLHPASWQVTESFIENDDSTIIVHQQMYNSDNELDSFGPHELGLVNVSPLSTDKYSMKSDIQEESPATPIKLKYVGVDIVEEMETNPITLNGQKEEPTPKHGDVEGSSSG